MRRSTKQWIAGGIAVLFLISTVIFAYVSMMSTPSQDQTQPQQLAPDYKPLDTSSKKVIAKYKGGEIVEGKFHAYINTYVAIQQITNPFVTLDLNDPQQREQMIKYYATIHTLAKEVKLDAKLQQNINNTYGEIEKALIDFEKQRTGKQVKNIDEALKGKGFTKEDLKEFVTLDALVDEALNRRIANMEYESVKLQHILIAFEPIGGNKRTDAEAKQRAEEVRSMLEKGEDFAKLAKEYSDDPGSKDKGGYYETAIDAFEPNFAQAARTLPINKISGLVKTRYGYHIIKVLERKKLKVSQATPDIIQSKKSQVFEEVMRSIKIEWIK